MMVFRVNIITHKTAPNHYRRLDIVYMIFKIKIVLTFSLSIVKKIRISGVRK
jgi:hypothetical protein